MARAKLNREKTVAMIREHNGKTPIEEIARLCGCGTTAIYQLKAEYGIYGKPVRKERDNIPETLWEGVSKRLLSVPFKDFPAHLTDKHKNAASTVEKQA